VVSGAAGLLLHHKWQGLHHAAYYSSPSDTPYHCATNAFPHTSGATEPATPNPSGATNPSSASRRPFQLRHRCGVHLGTRKEGLVLQSPPQGLSHTDAHRTPSCDASIACPASDASIACPASVASEASRSIQLRGWFLQLGRRMVGWKEGVVLQGSWEGMPTSSRRLRNHLSAIRLQCRLRKLVGRMVGCEEGLVLQKRWQGLPPSCRWLRIEREQLYGAARSAWRWRLRHLPALIVVL